MARFVILLALLCVSSVLSLQSNVDKAQVLDQAAELQSNSAVPPIDMLAIPKNVPHFVPDSIPELPEQYVPEHDVGSSFRFSEKAKASVGLESLNLDNPAFVVAQNPLGCGVAPPVPPCMLQPGSCNLDPAAKAAMEAERAELTEVAHKECIYRTISHQKQAIEQLEYISSVIRSKYNQALYHKNLIRNAITDAQTNLKKLTDLDRDDIAKLEARDARQAKKQAELQSAAEENIKKERVAMFEREKKQAEALREQTVKAEETAKKEVKEQGEKNKEAEERYKRNLAEKLAESGSQSSQTQSSQAQPTNTKQYRVSDNESVTAKLLPGSEKQKGSASDSTEMTQPKIVEALNGSAGGSSSAVTKDDRIDAESVEDKEKGAIVIHIRPDGAKVSKK